MLKKRIAYYLFTTGYGGAEAYLGIVLRHLDRTRFNPILFLRCTDAEADQRIRGEAATANVPVQDLDEKGWPMSLPQARAGFSVAAVSSTSQSRKRWSARQFIGSLIPEAVKAELYYRQCVQRAARHLKEQGFDIIHFVHCDYPSLEIPILAARQAGIPVRISDVQIDPRDIQSRTRVRQRLASRAGRGTTRVRAMSRRMRKLLVEEFQVPSERIHLVSNGIDPEPFVRANGRETIRKTLGVQPGQTVAAVIARLSPEKGHPVLLEALATVKRSHSGLLCLLVGSGPSEALLRSQVHALGLENHVRFLGFRSDIPALLSAADVVVLPSLKEGVPAAVLEAMASARPLVATAVGGVVEVFVDGDMGRLVPPGDAPALAKAIDEVLSLDAPARERMGLLAREHVCSRYTQQRLLEQIFALYEGNGHGT